MQTALEKKTRGLLPVNWRFMRWLVYSSIISQRLFDFLNDQKKFKKAGPTPGPCSGKNLHKKYSVCKFLYTMLFHWIIKSSLDSASFAYHQNVISTIIFA